MIYYNYYTIQIRTAYVHVIISLKNRRFMRVAREVESPMEQKTIYYPIIVFLYNNCIQEKEIRVWLSSH